MSIDIGGTSTKLAIVGQQGVILEKSTLMTSAFKDEHTYFNSLFESIYTLLSMHNGQYKVNGIGLGAPSCNPIEGTIDGAANLPFPQKVEIARVLETEFDLPVYLIKDGNASALGEGLFGAAQNMDNYMVITLGTGLGCGIVSNKKIVSGNNGQAGEIGHSVIKRNGRECGCGKNGCLETYVSATGIKRTLFKLLTFSVAENSFKNIPFNEVSPKMIYEAAKIGNPIALKAFEQTGQILGEKLSELVAIFEPEAIFLAGGLSEAGTFLFDPVIAHMEHSLLDIYKGKIQVLPSSLKTNEAALLGAASLVWQNQNIKETCQL